MSFAFPIAISMIPVAIAAVLLLLGFAFTMKASLRVGGYVLVGIGALFGLAFGPMLLMDKVTINGEFVEQRTGFWFAQTVKGFKLSDVSRIEIRKRLDRHGIENDLWKIYYKDSGVQEIDPGDLWEMNTDQIVSFLEREGVVVDRQHGIQIK